MLSRRRLPLLVAFPALYVGIAAVRAGEARTSAWFFVVTAIVVALVGGRVSEGLSPVAARRRRWTALGVSVAIATAALSARPAWAALARELAAFAATLAALRSLREIDGEVGLAPKASEASALPGFGPLAIERAATGLLASSWGLAACVDGLSLVGASATSPSPAIAAVCGAIAVATLGATAWLTAMMRRLELAVSPRALACAGAVALGCVVALVLAITDVVTIDAAIALGGTIASAIVVRLAQASDPLALARRGRRVLTLVLFAGPVVVFAALATEGRMAGTAWVIVGLGALGVVVGAFSRTLEEPFLPAKGTLLTALSSAREATREREARACIAHALGLLRDASAVGLGPTRAPSPELWLLHPTRVMTVNAAGYLQEQSADLPAGIFDIALGEPHATLRASVLRALEVRRADLRPFLAWLDHRDAIFATVIAESEDPDGLLVVPRGARTDELTLEEARAAKRLADAFVAVAQATSARERHLDRELALTRRIDALDEEIAQLRHTLDLDGGKNALASARLARPATVGIYSAASRMAYDALERRILQDAPTVVMARAGIDPIPFLARAHLGGTRKNAPFVVVDATSSREHDLDRWTDARTSPLALADRGLLFLADGAALPRDVQVLVARAVAERRAPWERAASLDLSIALGTTTSIADLVDAGRLAPELAARFEAHEAIVLPGLRDRPEDLRSIVADRLAREGLRVLGRPVGIDAAAYARLVEYPFDGEDAELASIVTRLVARLVQSGTSEDVVRRADVDALGLEVSEPEEERRPWPGSARS